MKQMQRQTSQDPDTSMPQLEPEVNILVLLKYLLLFSYLFFVICSTNYCPLYFLCCVHSLLQLV